MQASTQYKLWANVPAALKITKTKAVLSSTFKKLNGKEIHLLAFDDFVISYAKLLKSKEDTIPKGMLVLNYYTKFEIVRKEVIQKKEEPPALGKVLSMNLSREKIDKVLLLFAEDQVILEWRDFLATKINQKQFHHMFRVFKKIGKGNFATVYMAERIEDGQEMAVKAFSKTAAFAENKGEDALINEISLMRKLNHKNLIQLYEVYETSNSIYMCQELLEGGSLYDILKNKPILDIQQCQTIMKGLLEGLEAMHQKDIMHRDLKLENILFRNVNDMNSVVIADFGLATNVNERPYLYTRCGTPGYVAPEVINERDMNAQYSSVCDVYSVGLIFYLLCTGKPAFHSKSYTEVVKLNREALIDFNSKEFDTINAESTQCLIVKFMIGKNLLQKMLEKDPKKRITASQALKHPFLLFQLNNQITENFDYIDEQEHFEKSSLENKNQIQVQMNKVHLLEKSPIPQSILIPARQFKKQVADEDSYMHQRSPVMNGKLTTPELASRGQSPSTPMNLISKSPKKYQPSKFKQDNQLVINGIQSRAEEVIERSSQQQFEEAKQTQHSKSIQKKLRDNY